VARQVGLRGLLHGRRRTGDRLVLSAVEHSALLHTAAWHAARGGSVQEVGVDHLGRVDVTAFVAACATSATAAAVLQAANTEVGTRQPVGQVAAALRDGGVPLLVDLAGVVGRDEPPVALVASAGQVLVADPRSWAGPPGVGVLVVRSAVRWRADGPLDEAEHGRVPGEVDVPAVLAAAAALLDAEQHRVQRAARARTLVDRLRAAAGQVQDTEVVGDPVDRLPHVMTSSSLFVDGEALVQALDARGIAVASGSACTASTLAPSHVLAAMGVLTHGNLRVTLPLDPDDAVADDVAALSAALPEVVAAVRAALGADRL
jgi:cysteine desulfurase